jgi:hypothetical protein
MFVIILRRTINPWSDNSGTYPFDTLCVSDQGIYVASVGVAGVDNYGWTFSGSPTIENSAPTGFGPNANGTPRRLGATWDVAGPQTVDLTVTFEDGCVADAPQIQVQIGEADPTINTG